MNDTRILAKKVQALPQLNDACPGWLRSAVGSAGKSHRQVRGQ